MLAEPLGGQGHELENPRSHPMNAGKFGDRFLASGAGILIFRRCSLAEKWKRLGDPHPHSDLCLMAHRRTVRVPGAQEAPVPGQVLRGSLTLLFAAVGAVHSSVPEPLVNTSVLHRVRRSESLLQSVRGRLGRRRLH